MSSGIYKIVTCDRCGYEIRYTKEEADRMTGRLPEGWGAATGKITESDLCPRCLAKYKRLSKEFMEGKHERLD